jgi:type I restriction enzyme R subunit
LDFVGIFERLEKALAFDSDVVASCIQNLDVLKQLFETTLKTQAPPYLELAKGFDDKSKDRAIQHFDDKKKREEFFKFFRDLQRLYDVLSPDAFLRPYIKPFENLAALYLLIRNAYSNKPYVDRELTHKTKELLREHTEFSGLGLPGQIHKLGEKELNLIRDSSASDTAKILNLRKLLAKVVSEESTSKPFLISIGERAEKLAEAYEDRLLTTQQTLEDFWKLIEEALNAGEERNTLGLDENSFAIYTVLKTAANNCDPAHAKEINVMFAQYPDYQWNQQERNKLRGELYKILLNVVGDKKMIDVANTLLKLQRI